MAFKKNYFLQNILKMSVSWQPLERERKQNTDLES
jgi:hypothetical protein